MRFEVEGWDKLWALKSQLEIPLSHIRAFALIPSRRAGGGTGCGWPALRCRVSSRPVRSISWGGAVFYDVHDPDGTIVIELDHEHYKRLVIEVASPDEAVATLTRALAHRST